MTDVTCFWIAFAAYLAAMLVLAAASVRRAGPLCEGLAKAGRALVGLGLLAQTASIAWRGLSLGTRSLHEFFGGMSAAFSAGPRWQAVAYGALIGLAVLAVAAVALFRRRRTVWLLTLGVAVILALIVLDFLDFARMPIQKVYEYLSLASWCSALALLALSPLLGSVVLDAALAVAASLLAVFAAIQPKSVELQLVPALQSYWLFIHVSLTSLGYAIFGMAFILAALFIVKAQEPSAVEPATRRRAWLALGVALGVGAVITAALAAAGVILPFREVAFSPDQLAGGETPSAGLMQVVRYGAALLGAGCAVAYVAYWIAGALLRPRAAGAGVLPYLFVLSALALFAACLILGGFVGHQEAAIGRLSEQQEYLARRMDRLFPREGGALTAEAVAEEVKRLRSLSEQARRILGQARWLPVTLDKEAALAADPLFQSLKELYEKAGVNWGVPVRYKDIQQIGRALSEQASLLEDVARRLQLPADREALARARKAIAEDYEGLQAAALLPRGNEGAMAAFVGIACLLAIPLGVGLHALARPLRRILPDAKRLDTLSYAAIAIAYPIFTFGALFAGAIWAHFAWGNWWSWDPKEVGSLVAWVLYTIYLHQRYREGLSPRAAAVAGMLGFLAATLSLAGNAFLGGLHAYS